MAKKTVTTFKIPAGTSQTVTISFKNVGTKTWKAEGKGFVSIYTFGPKYRKTVFSDDSWMSDTQPTKLTETTVKPGKTGTFTFTLFAPLKTGTYLETFALASEGSKWLENGSFTLKIKVTANALKDPESGMSLAPGYKALRMIMSDDSLSLDPGQTKELRVAFKNVGKKSWKKTDKKQITIRGDGDNTLVFKDTSWTNNIASNLSSDVVKPGQLAFFTLKVSAPQKTGNYTPKFILTAGEDIIDGGDMELPIEVQNNQVSPEVSPLIQSEYSQAGPRGPNVRIGLFSIASTLTIAADGTYTLFDGDHNKIRQLSSISTVTFDPATLASTVTNGSFTWTTTSHVVFVPDDPSSTIFQLPSYDNRAAWDDTVNFNRFRGTIEVDFAPLTGRVWVVEELPVEDYLRGIGETSNTSPAEFQKALITAARTYALYVKSIGGKHSNEFFDMTTSGADQVYKGYASELVRPNVANAAEETRGTVVTYNGAMVVTPYFSRSDGRTRSWTEVWHGDVHPWLVSVPAPYDVGKTLWGHGVGMSASDAVGMANAGVSWMNILKYYYSGVALNRLY